MFISRAVIAIVTSAAALAFAQGQAQTQEQAKEQEQKLAPGTPFHARLDEPLASSQKLFSVLVHYAREQQDWTVCIPPGSRKATVMEAVETEWKVQGIDGMPTQRQALHALAARFPCPFSPYRPELRPATAADLVADWVTRDVSLRFPRRSLHWKEEGNLPLKCESLTYGAEGDRRVIQLPGATNDCPVKASLIRRWRNLPAVAFWRMDHDGSVIVTRTDVPGHREEWEAFIVVSAFREEGVEFEPGDLLQYQRFLNGMPFRFAIRFQHFRKLEQDAPPVTPPREPPASLALLRQHRAQRRD